MFGKLKEKLKNWTKKVSKETEEKAEEIVEEPKEENEDKKKSENKKSKKKKKEAQPLETEEPLPESPSLKTSRQVGRTISREDLLKANLKEPRGVVSRGSEALAGGAESIKESEKPSEPKKSFFKKVAEKATHVKISEEEFEKHAEDLEMILLENNVALEVTEKILEELKNKIVNEPIKQSKIEEKILESLKEIIENVLIEPPSVIQEIKESNEPYVILFCGINGTGKTTSIAKLAHKLKEENILCVMAAADTFRAAAIDQIKKHGEKLDIKVISSEYGADSASVGFDAINYAKKNKIKCVLIDTAGRMHTSKNLLKEIEKIAKVCKPNKKIFVGESTTGNDSVEQVKAFDKAISIDGIILSKADIDEKGGTALSVGYTTKKPILFLGTGQEYEKLETFDKKKFIEKLGF